MDSSRLTTEQLQWLNKRVGDFNRLITEVRMRMSRQDMPADDEVYAALNKVNAATFELCRVTASMLKEREQEQSRPTWLAHSERP